MVGVAQLVEHWIVAPDVEGSSPFTHPNYLSIACESGGIGRRAGFRFQCLKRRESSSLSFRTTT